MSPSRPCRRANEQSTGPRRKGCGSWRGLITGQRRASGTDIKPTYSQCVGQRRKKDGYRYQKLPGGDHSALGDFRAALAAIERMANG